MAFSASAYRDIQGHVDNILGFQFPYKDAVKCKVWAIFLFQVAGRRRGNEVHFPQSRGIRRSKTKRAEQTSR